MLKGIKFLCLKPRQLEDIVMFFLNKLPLKSDPQEIQESLKTLINILEYFRSNDNTY